MSLERGSMHPMGELAQANGRFLNVPPEWQSKFKLQRRVSLLLQHMLPWGKRMQIKLWLGALATVT